MMPREMELGRASGIGPGAEGLSRQRGGEDFIDKVAVLGEDAGYVRVSVSDAASEDDTVRTTPHALVASELSLEGLDVPFLAFQTSERKAELSARFWCKLSQEVNHLSGKTDCRHSSMAEIGKNLVRPFW